MIHTWIIYNLYALIITAGVLFFLNRYKIERAVERSILLILEQQGFLALGAILLPIDGFGLERCNAPRLNFLCRPEFIIIDL